MERFFNPSQFGERYIPTSAYLEELGVCYLVFGLFHVFRTLLFLLEGGSSA